MRKSLDGQRCRASGTENAATTISDPQTFEDSDSSFEKSKSQANSKDFRRSSSVFDISRGNETFKTRNKLLHTFSFRLKSKKKRSSARFRFKTSLDKKKENSQNHLKTPDLRISCAEENPSKLQRTDSFLRRFVKSSKDNIAESCERLVRNIQKSPRLLKKKLLSSKSSDSLGSSKSAERPIPPFRKKKSIKKTNQRDNLPKKEETFSVEHEKHIPEPKFFSFPEYERESPENQFYPNKNYAFIKETSESESVSVEDVDDLIRSEDNFRLLEERCLLKRRLKFLEDSFPTPGNKSRSTESLSKFSSPDYLKSRRQFQESVLDLGESEGSLGFNRKHDKLKYSPPPDEVQVQSLLKLLPIKDKHGSDKQDLTERQISSNDSHAQPDVSLVSLLGVKCRLANFASASERLKVGGREESAILVSVESLRQDSLVTELSPDPNNPRIRDKEKAPGIPGESGVTDSEVNDQQETYFDSSDIRESYKIRRDSCLSNVTLDWDFHQSDNQPDSENENKERTLVIENNPKNRYLKNNYLTKDKNSSQKKSRKKVSLKRLVRIKKESMMKLAVRFIRFRERLILSLSAFAILFTVFLVMDLQLDLGYSGHHLVPSHGRVKFGEDPNRDTVYNNFRRKFLQRVNGSKEQSGGDVFGSGQTTKGEGSSVKKGERPEEMEEHDDFADLMEYVVRGDGVTVGEGVVRISGEDHTDSLTIGEIRNIPFR